VTTNHRLRRAATGRREAWSRSAIEFAAQPVLKPHAPRGPAVKVRLTKSAGDRACGRLAASDPDREFEETCEKLATLAPHLVAR